MKLKLLYLLLIWNVLNLLDALTTFFLLKFELVYDANTLINLLNFNWGRGFVFVYFLVVAIIGNVFVFNYRNDKIKDYIIGGLVFYSFIIFLAVVQNLRLYFDWFY